ncbi:MAG: lysophospholipid acyltransferase family protein [Gemmatimonadota bacterium]|nr:lysophospholipid acyltransferase family protein [Gemmatimonadota bacterium]
MNEIGFESVGVLGTGFMAALFASTRMRCEGVDHRRRLLDSRRPVILVCWHSQLLSLIHHHRDQGLVVLVSEHADGEYLTRVLRRQGYGTVRGSSTRGRTAGLRGLIRASRAGYDLAVTSDGPTGPAGVMKPGALWVARSTGATVVPMAAGSAAEWRFRSWDGFRVPRPFSKVTVRYGTPVEVPPEASREQVEALRREVEGELHRLTAQVCPSREEA